MNEDRKKSGGIMKTQCNGRKERSKGVFTKLGPKHKAKDLGLQTEKSRV